MRSRTSCITHTKWRQQEGLVRTRSLVSPIQSGPKPYLGAAVVGGCPLPFYSPPLKCIAVNAVIGGWLALSNPAPRHHDTLRQGTPSSHQPHFLCVYTHVYVVYMCMYGLYQPTDKTDPSQNSLITFNVKSMYICVCCLYPPTMLLRQVPVLAC